MTIGWLKIRWHCVVLVDEHCLLFAATLNLDFIIDVVIEIANVDAVYKVHLGMMHSCSSSQYQYIVSPILNFGASVMSIC